MSSDVEKSFLATLTYYAGLDARNNPINVPIDFSYVAVVEAKGTPIDNRSGDAASHLTNIPDQYLYANAYASNPVQFYFRYNGSKGKYSIWIRNGKQAGRRLARSANGYIYADSVGERPGDFSLIREGKKATLDDFTEDTEEGILLQLYINGSGYNLELYTRVAPESKSSDKWYAYVVDSGTGNAHFTLNIQQKNVYYKNPEAFIDDLKTNTEDLPNTIPAETVEDDIVFETVKIKKYATRDDRFLPISEKNIFE
ncbi:MAG: hypothetical protein ACOH2O_22265 [Pseudomonas sp.]